MTARKQRTSPLGLGVFGSDYSLTFFSEARLASLSARLGHNKVNQIVDKVAGIISDRMKTIDRVPAPPEDRTSMLGAEKGYILACVTAYFEQIHPFHPFLNRKQFEALALGTQASSLLAEDKTWSALFYAVLALGSQCRDGGSFQPGKKLAWRFFSIALALFPDLLIAKSTLTTIQIGTVLVLEGAKRAQAFGYNKATTSPNDARSRTFWVLYCLEKMISFNTGKSSVLNDSDISCTIAPLPEPAFGNFDWLLTFVKHTRLLARLHATLYSVSAAGRSLEYYRAAVQQLLGELEVWKSTIPSNLKPGEALQPHALPGSQMIMIYIMVNYLYYNTALTLHRAALQLEIDGQETGCLSPKSGNVRREASMLALIKSARSILELTRFIEVEPHTPIWYVREVRLGREVAANGHARVLAAVPLGALFVLFDLVIHNPNHAETSTNLAVLDVGGGYFSRIEYKSDGNLPGSLAAGFAHIAREYVQNTQKNAGLSDHLRRRSSSSEISAEVNTASVESVMPSGASDTSGTRLDSAVYENYYMATDLSTGTNMMEIFGAYDPGIDAMFGFVEENW
ncbi:hypothetical protein SLS56_010491 [Neofusicoccum ribis]|uniref:Xylanolytic transcriptional activator regulatory domain-containing protein n=1 Tax=Neofusicoccum ribis TaxID=45134 RepID=A0ABR3SE77_9PEZI